MDESSAWYTLLLEYDNTHVEAMACLAAHHFYHDQPEVALRYYRRLLQLGGMFKCTLTLFRFYWFECVVRVCICLEVLIGGCLSFECACVLCIRRISLVLFVLFAFSSLHYSEQH
jgi:hypothetical protein